MTVPRPRPNLAHVLVLAALVVGGAVVRVLLVGEPMRYDESFAFTEFAAHPVGYITTDYAIPNNHILHTLAVHYAWRAFGDHVWVVRLPALLAGVALIPAAYLAAERLYSRRAALWAAALVAGFAPLVDYSVNARGYTIGILFVLLALRLAADLLDRPRPWAWAAFVACCALAFYTVPTLSYGVATVAAWMAGVALLRRDVGTLVRLAAALAIAAGLDVLLYSGVLAQRGWTLSRPLHDTFGAATGLAGQVWENWNRAAPHPLDWLVVGGFVVSLVLHRRLARHPLPLVAPAAAVILGVVAFTPAARFPRAWLVFLPLYLIHAGAGLSYLAERLAGRLPRPALAGGIVAVVVAAALWASVLDVGEHGADQPPASDNHIVAFMKRELRPGEAALFEGDVAVASNYYFHQDVYFPPHLPVHRRPTSALVIVFRGGGVSRIDRAVRAAGWRIQAGATTPHLVRRLEYVEAWRVRVQ